MLVEKLPGEDPALDDCARRVTDPAVLVLRYADLWLAVTELRCRQAEQRLGRLAVLDLVGHGEAGALGVGNAQLSGDPQQQRVLVQLLNPPALIDARTVLRLLGCGVGVGGLAHELPLAAEGDGALLAVGLKRRLGCRVQVAMVGLDPSDYGARGFGNRAVLAEAVAAERIALAPVNGPAR